MSLSLIGFDINVAGQSHRPGTVVIGSKTRVGIGLLFEKCFRQRPIRLIQLDDVRARTVGRFTNLEPHRCAVNLDRLPAEQVDDAIHLSLVGLAGGNDKGIRRLCLACFDSMEAFLVEIFDHHRGKLRRQLECGEQRGL